MKLSEYVGFVVLVSCSIFTSASWTNDANPGLPLTSKSIGLAPQEIQAAAAEQTQHHHHYTSREVLGFMLNVHCLQAAFYSYGAFAVDMDATLSGHKTKPQGGRKAALSPDIEAFIAELALIEAGHVRLIHEALGDASPPCPLINIGTAFGSFLHSSISSSESRPGASEQAPLHTGQTRENEVDAPESLQDRAIAHNWDPYTNNTNYLLSAFILSDIAASAAQGGVLLTAYNLAERDHSEKGNLTEVALITGIAGASHQQTSVIRWMLWQRRHEEVPELGLNVNEVVQWVSALRQHLSGEIKIDQPLEMPPEGSLNIIPADGNGATYARMPQQVLNILTHGGSAGGFLPEGPMGSITANATKGGGLEPAVPSILIRAANAPYTVVHEAGVADPNEPAVARLKERFWQKVTQAFGGMINEEF